MNASPNQLNLNFPSRLFRLIAWLGVLTVITVMVFQRHQNTGYFNWRSKMWGDQAGYYVYSPAFFIYGFDGKKLPDNIVEKTGDGFSINEEGRIITRYTTGVAILQAPVFLVVHAVAGIQGQEQDGFSGIYHLVTSFSAILYSFLGLMFLWSFLLYYFKRTIAFFTLVTVFFGTNVLYYTIDATGMSHIYSFFLFSLLLLLSKLFFSISADSRKRNLYFTMIAVTSAMIVLVRPTNLVFVGLVFLLDITSWNELKERFILVFTLKRIFIAAVAFFLVFLPQMLYWKYSSGSYITDSYEGYGFTNWATPQTGKFLFSTNNGLFLYNPVYFLILFALFCMIKDNRHNGYYILVMFAGLIYLFSSWFVFSFGCGFGSRNFVEYAAVFSLPLGYVFNKFFRKPGKKKYIIAILAFIFVFVNLKLTSAYDKCFLNGDWDFREYSYLLKTRKYSGRRLSFNAELLNSDKEFSKGLNVNLKNSAWVNYRRAFVSVDAEIYEPATEAAIVVVITSKDSIISWNGYPLKNQYNFMHQGEKQRIRADFYLPRYYTTNSVITTYIWNINKDSLRVSNLKLRLE